MLLSCKCLLHCRIAYRRSRILTLNGYTSVLTFGYDVDTLIP